MMEPNKIPTSSIDLYDDEVLLNPYEAYRQLREQGPVVHLDKLDMFVFSRFRQVRDALGNSQIFSSASGVMMNQPMNEILKGIVLCSDGNEHAAMRRTLMKPVTPSALRLLRERIELEAEGLVERLVARRRFDAATELAQYLPVTIVSNLVGLPEEGREKMLEWAAANFNCFGPMNKRAEDSFDSLKEMVNYALTQSVRGKVKPGSWAEMLHDAGDRGDIPMEKCSLMALDYMGPSLDTTIFAIGSAIWLFAKNPEQWDRLRENPALIPNAVNEVVRIESPIQGFSRFTTEDYQIEDSIIPKNSRVIMLYGSANRDERRWMEPEKFDIGRDVVEHVGFGHGEHSCVGMNLARMEIHAILSALTRRVARFELNGTKRALNNVLRGFQSVDVTIH